MPWYIKRAWPPNSSAEYFRINYCQAVYAAYTQDGIIILPAAAGLAELLPDSIIIKGEGNYDDETEQPSLQYMEIEILLHS